MVIHVTKPIEFTGTDTGPKALWSPTPLRRARVVKIAVANEDTQSHEVRIGSYDGTTFSDIGVPIIVGAGTTVVLDPYISSDVYRKDPATSVSIAAEIDKAVSTGAVYVQAVIEEE